jgi:hypothetical protein
METVKVVAHHQNGVVIRGHTLDFFQNRPTFHITVLGKESEGAKQIQVAELKALFFVKLFLGDPKHKDVKQFLPTDVRPGRKIEVVFKDGEVMVGKTMGYDPQRTGFFLFPADQGNNNTSVFVVMSAVKSTRWL